jgi:hypothetical protein
MKIKQNYYFHNLKALIDNISYQFVTAKRNYTKKNILDSNILVYIIVIVKNVKINKLCIIVYTILKFNQHQIY